MGVGPVPENWDAADFVLGKFAKAEKDTIDETIARAADGAECWVTQGIAASMNQYN
jgi:PTH1 family peptidyl-tRNA hydrolase